MTHYLTSNIPPTKKKSNLTKSFKINVKDSLNHIEKGNCLNALFTP